jgi:hypothetical protein
MKELITITKGQYHLLLGKTLELEELRAKHTDLESRYRDLERRHYVMLVGDNKQAKELVNLGNYAAETVTE